MSGTVTLRSIEDLKVYQAAYRLAMQIFEATKQFPKEERYSLTDQIRRSARSVAANVREGFGKRKYGQVFIRHLSDALGSSEETRVWLKFGLDCGYLAQQDYEPLDRGYDEVNAMLYSLMERWQTFEFGAGAET